MELGTVRADGRVYSNVYGGVPRWLEKRICANKKCGSEFLAAPHRKTKFCSQQCQGKYKSIENSSTVCCATCGTTITRANSKVDIGKHGHNFCSRGCKEKAQSIEGNIPEIRPSHYRDGKSKYRHRAFKAKGIICVKCGYNEDDRMLDVHHIDGNRANGGLENLEVLCVWCHALETRKNWSHYSK